MVYIDNAKNHFRNMICCHMLAIPPHDPELDVIAQKVGLKKKWKQTIKNWPHYDISQSLRNKCIKEGALSISTKDLARRRSDYRRRFHDE